MKTADPIPTFSRVAFTAAYVVLSVGLLLIALHAVFVLGADLLEPAQFTRLLLAALIAIAPAAGVVWAMLTLRRRRNTPPGPSAGGQSKSAKPEASNLDEALGSSHMSELRAQVDLLCAMAGGDRMSSALSEELKRSGFSGLAHQASVSAQVVARILFNPRLAEELGQNVQNIGGTGLTDLQRDLSAIAVSLEWLSERTGTGATPMPVWIDIELREKLTLSMSAVDQLLVQSTLLLSTVSDLAYNLAASYGRVRGESGAVPGTQEGRAVRDAATAIGSFDIPTWKLN